MKANADDILENIFMVGVEHQKRTIPEIETLQAEAKQQLADGLVAALPKRIDMQSTNRQAIYSEAEDYYNHDLGFNNAIDQTEAAIYSYFGIGRNQDGDSK